MKYVIETWQIKELIRQHDEDKIDLQPPYQRNPVWTLKAQKALMESILTGKPIPAFFLRRRPNGFYEMVDGQQRARTILAYSKDLLVDHENLTFTQRLAQHPKAGKAQFLDYRLIVTIVFDLEAGESIQDYYSLLNSSGLRLNRPELKKAEYFRTNFLKLIMECAADRELQSLRLFTEASTRRMNEVDFVSELIATIKFGLSDKKDKVDELYEDDISQAEFKQLKNAFQAQVRFWVGCNQLTPLLRTRYKQKNDFYSLFYFYYTKRRRAVALREHWYRVLVRLGPHIRPSQNECEPLRLYAHHCVTQSNSRLARQARHQILEELLIASGRGVSPAQDEVLRYFGLTRKSMVRVEGVLTLDDASLRDPRNRELDFDRDEI